MLTFKGMTIPGIFRRSWNGFNKHLARKLMPLLVHPEKAKYPLEHLGQGDGTWPVQLKLLSPGSICYCVGVGLNATFDLALAARGLEVHSFDPTPKAKDYALKIDLAGRGVQFHPIGIWNKPTVLRFYAPSNSAYPNYSVVDLHGTADFVEAECETMENVMARLSHTEVAILKLDVEGSWPPILEHLLVTPIRPQQLCVEFDSPTSVIKILRMINQLRQAGYSVSWFEKENFVFTHKGNTNGKSA